jgi:hypothetical protein
MTLYTVVIAALSVGLVVAALRTYRESGRIARAIKESCTRSLEVMKRWGSP